MLDCIDPARWNSLARPAASGLGGLVFRLHADLASALGEVIDLS